MLYSFAMMLMTLWLLGVVNGYSIGGFIHLLPVMAVVLALLNFHLRDRRI